MPLQVLAYVLGAVTLALPLALAAAGPLTLTAARATALLAYSFLFHNIMTGSMGVPLFYRLFKPGLVRRYHVMSGVAGFGLAVAHMVIVLASLPLGVFGAAWIIGPVALGLLAVTVAAALGRKRLPGVWRRIHQLNYAIFLAIYVKAVMIGSDLELVPWLKVVFTLYLAAAALGLLSRLVRYTLLKRGKKAVSR